eukprot:gnl/TRDRNA2_/TRDRNA2_196629_c0_seq1.p1 gnl/TRDRNA2_/TRDRNA2_196629_c0~~gnl/TRDRNA2_/TRDRNA2_196629_c0_seq1.p1  ORF type:complete len:538 (-),score=118.82 gnl/TRDRNA2_/TRDRNA2_196629_c0_seq1:65-1678(-)
MGVADMVRPIILGCMAIGLFGTGFLYGGLGNAPPAEPTMVKKPFFQPMDLSFFGNPFLRTSDLDSLSKLLVEASGWPPVNILTLDVLPQRQKGYQQLMNDTNKLMEGAMMSMADRKYAKLLPALELVKKATTIEHFYLKHLLPAAAGANPDQKKKFGPNGETIVTVKERPFGMRLKRGSLRVEQVFPGFPAHNLGITAGCVVLEVAKTEAEAGTWMQLFQSSKLPFELKLSCKAEDKVHDTNEGRSGPMSTDPEHFVAMVTKKPWGMNIQANVVPRVVEVLPGFPAEAAGVRKGFVLTEVAGQPVTAENWFNAFQETPLPFAVTFNTTVPLHAGNPFFSANATGTGEDDEKGAGASQAATTPMPTPPPLDPNEYTDWQCDVTKLPFGMQVRAARGDYPRVIAVLPFTPSAKAGVKVGDILIEVAGRPVDYISWFAAFQQAVPPFGLKFKRPLKNMQQSLGGYAASGLGGALGGLKKMLDASRDNAQKMFKKQSEAIEGLHKPPGLDNKVAGYVPPMGAMHKPSQGKGKGKSKEEQNR